MIEFLGDSLKHVPFGVKPEVPGVRIPEKPHAPEKTGPETKAEEAQP